MNKILIADRIGYPIMIMIKVVAGGGKGMRIVTGPEEVSGAVRAARSETNTRPSSHG